MKLLFIKNIPKGHISRSGQLQLRINILYEPLEWMTLQILSQLLPLTNITTLVRVIF